jgi:8-oxo-dGTP pyrophosphatase MutT (NUDIX family)
VADPAEPAQRERSWTGAGVDRVWRVAYRVAFRLQTLYWRVRPTTLTGSYVAVWHGGRLLCVRNSYRRVLTLPAGGLARGESPRAAAVRELYEEVAIEAAPEALAYVGEIVSHVGGVEDRAHFFELHCDERAPAFQVDRREVVWAAFLAPHELRAAGTVDVVRLYLERIGSFPSE